MQRKGGKGQGLKEFPSAIFFLNNLNSKEKKMDLFGVKSAGRCYCVNAHVPIKGERRRVRRLVGNSHPLVQC